MQKQIIALFGKHDSGKSTTIAYVLAELEKHASDTNVTRGRERDNGPPEVWSATLTIDGVRVGIASPGDNEETVTRRVQPLIEADCQVIVCATRTGGGSVAALRHLASTAEPPFEIKWIAKASNKMASEHQNRLACDDIVAKVLEAVASFQLAAV